MIRHAVILGLSIFSLSLVEAAKQQVQLSDSYLPVAMQVISHLTDQMAYEAKEETTPRPTTKPTAKPTARPTISPTTRPPTRPATRPTTRPTTSRPYVTYPAFSKPTNTWWTGFTTRRPEATTQHHKPGLYAPFSPPKPSDRFSWDQRYVLLPLEHNAQYTILKPHGSSNWNPAPLLSIHNEQINPIMEPAPAKQPLLPPHNDVKISSRSDGYDPDEINEENLQYLSDDVREMIKTANDPHNDKLVDVWEGVRQGNQPIAAKAKLSASNLRLLLLYDLLSREAKRQRLSDYSGFSPDVMKNLVDSSTGGARAQLRMALSKMVERRDCGHEYANNRAKEMVEELGKDESGLSAALRYLQPIVYAY